MKVLLLFTAFNGLSQSVLTHLTDKQHTVKLCLAADEALLRQNIVSFKPDLILCPFLKQRIADDIWQQHTCIIIHPGIKGDRGASSIDWAILSEQTRWGVTALQADSEMDAGDIWASFEFSMPAVTQTTKASLYRNQVTQAALKCVDAVLAQFADPAYVPRPLNYQDEDVEGQLQPNMAQHIRQIDWQCDSSETILKKINCADSFPGVKETICGQEVYLFNAHRESQLSADTPKKLLAQRHGAICLSTIDGAIWIGHLKRATQASCNIDFGKKSFKLPASWVLGNEVLLSNNLNSYDEDNHKVPTYLNFDDETYHEIRYQRIGDIGFLYFDFHNGAMGTSQCQRLLQAYNELICTDIKAIVLMGGRDFWSNGIHLNHIEHSDDPAAESWRNINAINDVVKAIFDTQDKLTIAAFGANAGAGGVMMGLACDKVISRASCIFNPHYQTMGLYGSEYWTYSLPKRVGQQIALELVETCLPVNATKALELGLVDRLFDCDYDNFKHKIIAYLAPLLEMDAYQSAITHKQLVRLRDEAIKPLAEYREQELKKMEQCFQSDKYHKLRHDFVYKVCQRVLPAYLAHIFGSNQDSQSKAKAS